MDQGCKYDQKESKTKLRTKSKAKISARNPMCTVRFCGFAGLAIHASETSSSPGLRALQTKALLT